MSIAAAPDGRVQGAKKMGKIENFKLKKIDNLHSANPKIMNQINEDSIRDCDLSKGHNFC